jgi:mannosylfructose-6-phosphate phosphatase
MARGRLKYIRLFSADLDGTLVGEREAEAHFLRAWMGIEDSRRPLLVYNSGRLIDDMRRLLPRTNLPPADIFIGGVGTMLFRFGCIADGYAYGSALSGGFDWEAIRELLEPVSGLELQPMQYQARYKSSWYLRNAGTDQLHHIEAILSEAGLCVKLVYSSGRDLDVLPRNADKGSALVWLCRRLGIDLSEVLVAGDTNNDRSMFELPGVRGILVANAHEDLRRIMHSNGQIYHARQQESLGVVEGLGFFGLLGEDDRGPRLGFNQIA